MQLRTRTKILSVLYIHDALRSQYQLPVLGGSLSSFIKHNLMYNGIWHQGHVTGFSAAGRVEELLLK